jgi:hypothetical protein
MNEKGTRQRLADNRKALSKLKSSLIGMTGQSRGFLRATNIQK